MKNQKHTGSYYTPEFLSKFILNYIAPKIKNRDQLSIFEPSVGDGSFVKAFNETEFPSDIRTFNFFGVDKILPELRKAKEQAKINRKKNAKYSFRKADFLKLQSSIKRRFSVVIGNPPYLRKGLLNKTQIALCEKIHASAGLAPLTIKNIWPSFLVRCAQLLDNDGILSMVLPAELLQVKFSTEIRSFLTLNFQRTEVFSFDDLLFECEGQDTVLLIAYKKSESPGQYFTRIKSKEHLLSNGFQLVENRSLAITETKWSHHTLSSDELAFIHRLGQSLKQVNYYCESKPGIVTAANNFFIVNTDTESEFGLRRYTRPIIQKGLFVNGSVVFDTRDFNNLMLDGKPSKLICINDQQATELPDMVRSYLETGEELGLQNRYKCLKRNNWFVIPNISTVPDGFFFKRSHFYPKILKNNAQVLVTDSAYKVDMKDGYNINHLIYSFYNSLTLIFSELEGRYYGGGVLELTPSEFKKLPIPMTAITAREFNAYKTSFKNKSSIAEILNLNDSPILHGTLHIGGDDILKIKDIYQKLTAKRFRKTSLSS